MLSPIIVDGIRRQRDLKEIKKALFVELRELQFRLTLTVYFGARHTGKYDRNLLEWMRPIVESYGGINQSDNLWQEIRLGLERTDEQLRLVSEQIASNQNRGIAFKKYNATLLEAKINQLGAFDQESQNLLLEIKTRLDILNEEIDQYRIYHNQTFNSSLSQQNHDLIRDNIRDSSETIYKLARSTTDLITKLLKKHLSNN